MSQYINDNATNLDQHVGPESVHLIVTSPPYNIGKGYDRCDDRRPLNEYIDEMRAIFEQCHTALVDGGRCCVNVPDTRVDGQHIALDVLFANLLGELGFTSRGKIVWHKSQISKRTAWGSFGSPSCPCLLPPFEYILVFHKGSKRLSGGTSPDITRDEFISWTNALWEFPPETRDLRHPAPFPVELPLRCMRLYSYPGQTVLDPFAGACTTAVAAERCKRECICVDLSAEYLEIGRRRVEEEARRLASTDPWDDVDLLCA